MLGLTAAGMHSYSNCPWKPLCSVETVLIRACGPEPPWIILTDNMLSSVLGKKKRKAIGVFTTLTNCVGETSFGGLQNFSHLILTEHLKSKQMNYAKHVDAFVCVCIIVLLPSRIYSRN